MPLLLRRLLFAVFVLIAAFPLLAAFDFLNGSGVPSLDSGGNTLLSRALLGCLVSLAAVLWLLIPPRPVDPPRRRATVALVALLAAWGLAATLSVCPFDSWLRWLQLFASALLFATAIEVGDGPGGLLRGLHVLLAIGVGVTLWGLALYFAARQPDAAVSGTFYQADVAAGWLLMLAPIALALAIGSRTPEHTLLYFLVALVLGGGLLLTYSRGGQLCLALVFALLTLATWRRVGARAPLIAAALGVSIVVFAGLVTGGGRVQVVPRKMVARTAELGTRDTSVRARVEFWSGALRMAAARPLAGWGPTSFGRIFPRYQPGVKFYSKYVHNEYLTLLSEGGVLTLGAFVAFLGILGWSAWWATRRAVDPADEAAPVRPVFGLYGAAAGLAAAALHLCVDVDWEFPVVQLTWFALAGLLVAGATEARPFAASRPPRAMLWRWVACLALLAGMTQIPRPYLASLFARQAAAEERAGHLDARVQRLGEAVAALPGSSEYRRRLADALLASAEMRPTRDVAAGQQAMAQAREAVRLDPERAVNHESVARAQVYLGDLDGAITSLREATARDAINFPNFYNLMADVRIAQRRLPEAYDLLQVPARMYTSEAFIGMWFFRVDSLKDQLSRTFLRLGEIAVLLKRPGEALEALRRAVEVDPHGIQARYQLGLLAMQGGDPGTAWLQFREILRMKPQHPISQWLLGLAYQELGQPDRAGALLAEAYRSQPDLREVGRKGRAVRIGADFFTPERSPAPAGAGSSFE